MVGRSFVLEDGFEGELGVGVQAVFPVLSGAGEFIESLQFMPFFGSDAL